jgi:aspartyl-tRNA(Asn)/glutamyl-tRNA(Gln) amidotransferase subunit A
MQIVGRHFDEALLFTIGDAFEAATDHHRKRPAIWPQ